MNDAERLKEQLEQATGERISALEGIGAETPEPGTGRAPAPLPDRGIEGELSSESSSGLLEKQAEIDLER